MPRIIALDLGTKSCGIAITDESKIISQPLENFIFPENHFMQVIKKLEELFKQYNCEKIILGYPTRMTGTKSERTIMVEQFKILLNKNFQQEVILFDERLTTKNAISIMKNAGLSIKKRKANKDKLAAQIILQNYLDVLM